MLLEHVCPIQEHVRILLLTKMKQTISELCIHALMKLLWYCVLV